MSPPTLITGLSTRGYLRGQTSLFRRYVEQFLERYGPELSGTVVEIGCEKGYNHRRFFPNAAGFRCTNVGRDYDEYLDVTDMPFPDSSQDAFVCASVLEHVFEIRRAWDEIDRTLKTGGRVLMVIPWAYPVHDVVDYWRVGPNAYQEMMPNYDIKAFVHLGGLYSTLATVLQRPKGNLSRRFLAQKLLGLFIAAIFARRERVDGFPLGFALYAEKTSTRAATPAKAPS